MLQSARHHRNRASKHLEVCAGLDHRPQAAHARDQTVGENIRFLVGTNDAVLLPALRCLQEDRPKVVESLGHVSRHAPVTLGQLGGGIDDDTNPWD